MTNPAWDTLTNLSIQTYVYDKDGFKLSDSATIYANDHHQAIVVVSFQALDKDGNVISGSELGSIGVIRKSTQLTDFETGTTLGELRVWTTDTGKSVFACPLGSSDHDDSICTGDSIEENDTVVLTFYVSTNNKAGKAKSISLGMQVNLKVLTGNANANIIESRRGGDLQEYCDLVIIDRSKIPEDIMVGHVSYETTKKDTIPTEVNLTPELEDYYRIVHYAYNFKFDGDSQNDDDFDYNNRIFRIGVFSDPTYNGNQDPNKDENDSEKSEEPHALTEPCCFIDQRDGFYNYKGYLWPIGFYKQASIYDDSPTEIDSNGADIGNFYLDQPRFPRKTVNPIEIFNKSPYELDKSQTLYLTMYLTFGDMVQFYRRQIFYKLDIIDQYGNNLEIEVNPQNTPSIFNKDDIDKCGISCFTATEKDAVKWLTTTGIPNQYNTIGDSTDVGFWLTAANNRYWAENHTLMYQTDNLNDISMVKYNSINTLVVPYGGDLAFRTYRKEGMNSTDSFPMDKLSYKMTMVHQKGNGEAYTTGIVDAKNSYVIGAVSILPIDGVPPTYTWKFFPVWGRGCFITWVESGNLGYINSTLIDNPDNKNRYEIGNSEGRTEMSLFSAIQAFEIAKSGMINQKLPVTDVLDGGLGGNGNPYAYDPSPDGKDRGDWAAVTGVRLMWGENSEPVGNSVYNNGLNQVCLILNFDAKTWDMADNSLHTCHNLPSQDFVENSVALIDYDTGNEINLMKAGWKYTLGDNAGSDFCRSPENGAFGVPGTSLPPKKNWRRQFYCEVLYI